MSLAAEPVLHVFWTMYEEQEVIADPIDIPTKDVPNLARVVLADNVQNFIGFVDLLKFFVCFLIIWIQIRMQFPR